MLVRIPSPFGSYFEIFIHMFLRYASSKIKTYCFLVKTSMLIYFSSKITLPCVTPVVGCFETTQAYHQKGMDQGSSKMDLDTKICKLICFLFTTSGQNDCGFF